MSTVKRFDVIIPHYSIGNVDALALRCLRSIRRFSRDYRLIFIDNGGGNILDDELQHHPAVVFRNPTNRGFVRAVNQGLRFAQAPYVVIMNNDTEAAQDWLQKLSEPLFVATVGMSGPRTTCKQEWQGRWPKRRGVRILNKTAMLAFFCVMIRADVIQKVGLLDEDFGVGLGDDDNYCWRVHAAGYDLALVENLLIPHNHRSTFRALYSQGEIRAMQIEALQIHKRKMVDATKNCNATNG